MNRVDISQYKAPEAAAPATDQGLDLREILQIIWGARWGLFFCALLGAAIAFAAAKQITPKYRSAASIMLDARQQNVIDLESVLSDVPLNRQMLESELLVLESDTLLERVVSKLRLDRDPEYNPSLARPSEMQLMVDEKAAKLTALAGIDLFGDPEPAEETNNKVQLSPAARTAEARRRAVRILRGKLKARQLAPAYALSVQIVSTDPVKAALIANTVADQYIVDQLEAKLTAARRATTWLTSRLEELRARVEASEAAMQAYKLQHQTGDSQGASITVQQIAQLNAELISAKAELAQSEATYQRAQEMVHTLGAAGAATALSSPLAISLRDRRAELKRQEAELSNRYGPKHPEMIELRTEIRNVNAAIASEVRQVVTSLGNNVEVAKAKVTSLADSLADVESRASGQSEAAVGLRQLEAEAEANRRIYNDFLQRLNETREQEGFQTADSRIIEPAVPSFAPFVPRTKVSAALGGVAGGAIGLGLLAFLRLFTQSFRTIASVTDQTSLPVLASIPKTPRRYMCNLLGYLEQRPNSELAESTRYLRNAMLTDSGGRHWSALITSSFPGEGKSTLSIMLAEMLGRAGKSVILLDCDARLPSLAPALSVKPSHDLFSILEDGAVLNDVAITPAHGHFHFIPLNPGQAARADHFATKRFAAFIAELEQAYDFVLIDAPPALGVSDFSVLGKLVDTTIVVVQWNKTPVTSFKRTLRWLADHRMEVLGAVLSKVDRRREAKYDTASYGAEYASFRRYYAN